MEESERADKVEEEGGGESKQQVWSWGAGTDGQLGTSTLQDQHLPQLLLSLPLRPISLLSCGGAHVIAVTPCGRVVTWGRGTSGQLGHGNMVNSLQPKRIHFLENFVISHVSAGWSHSGFVSDSGSVFTCGDGSFGQLGHGDYQSLSTPKLLSRFGSDHVLQIACGMRHSIVLSKDLPRGQVYGFGSGKRGQLGVSTDKIKSICVPRATFGMEDIDVASIVANGDHSGALSADGHLYVWGRGFSGTSDTYHPQCVPSMFRFTQVAFGWNHALVLTDDGEVFMMGGYRYGALTDPQKLIPMKNSFDSRELVLEKVHGLNGIKVAQIAAGAEHSVLITESRVTKTWGWGEHGQLGLGDTCDQTIPQTVSLDHELPHKYTTSKVYCGSGFTFALETIDPVL